LFLIYFINYSILIEKQNYLILCLNFSVHYSYTKFDVLILDDFGLKILSAEQSSDLYDLIAAVHINASLIITTNRKIETWAEIFFDPVMANAALDRIVNNAYRVVLEVRVNVKCGVWHD